MRRFLLTHWTIAVLVLLRAASSHAAEPQGPVAAQQRSQPRQPAAQARKARKPFAWRPEWRSPSWPEYLAAPLLMGAPELLRLTVKPLERARWRGPILFDAPLHDNARASGRAQRDFASELSDVLLWAGLATNLVIDPWIVGGALRLRPRIAWNMTLINMEVLGLVNTATRLTKLGTARERPYGEDCDRDPNFAPRCDSAHRYQSFFSGHTARSGTLAGLNCAHHLSLGLYGNRIADEAACAGSVALMVITGAMRLVSSNHWASDVLVGGAVGMSAGYLLPMWLYYDPETDAATGPRVTALPVVGRGVVGAAVSLRL